MWRNHSYQHGLNHHTNYTTWLFHLPSNWMTWCDLFEEREMHPIHSLLELHHRFWERQCVLPFVSLLCIQRIGIRRCLRLLLCSRRWRLQLNGWSGHPHQLARRNLLCLRLASNNLMMVEFRLQIWKIIICKIEKEKKKVDCE